MPSTRWRHAQASDPAGAETCHRQLSWDYCYRIGRAGTAATAGRGCAPDHFGRLGRLRRRAQRTAQQLLVLTSQICHGFAACTLVRLKPVSGPGLTAVVARPAGSFTRTGMSLRPAVVAVSTGLRCHLVPPCPVMSVPGMADRRPWRSYPQCPPVLGGQVRPGPDAGEEIPGIADVAELWQSALERR
jgi:hypothetical protein